MKTKLLYVILIVVAGIAITVASVNSVFGASLSNPFSSPSSNLQGLGSQWAVQFTPASTTQIKSIQIIFPQGTGVNKASSLVSQQGAPSGTTFSISNSASPPTVTLTANNAFTPSTSTPLIFFFAKIQQSNSLTGQQTITINTLDSSGMKIDNATATFSINNSVGPLTYNYTNNVGIGTTTPQNKLEVNGNIQADGNIIEGSAQTLKILPASGQAICIGSGC